MMKLSDFDYNLPKELIATHPTEPRDAAKMLVLDRQSCGLKDSHFYELPDFLEKGDVLVLNQSKVIPARLFGTKLDFYCSNEVRTKNASSSRQGSNSKIFEILLVKNLTDGIWEAWVRPGRKAKVGDIFEFNERLSAKLIERREEIFVFKFNLTGVEFFTELNKIGEMPVPPYILKAREASFDYCSNEVRTKNASSSRKSSNSKSEDISDYQTVFGTKEGSVAAPTAGLHFTDEILEKLKAKGIQIETVTLHVSLGTFQPVNTENVEDFQIHSEFFEIDEQTAARLNQAKAEGRRIIAVGTTSVRVLESAVIPCHSDREKRAEESLKGSLGKLRDDNFCLAPMSGETSIYIYPGYQFKYVDGIITNFHLPKSSLLLLVAAFTSKDCIMNAYDHAIQNHYRFYSYGDGMLIT